MRRFLTLLLTAELACATPPAPPPPPLVPVSKQVELSPLPPDPSTEPLDPGLPKGDWVEAIEQGKVARAAGILESEERAWRNGKYRTRYPDLRKSYEADRGVWTAHRELYEARHADDVKKLEAAQPNFWERHAPELCLIGGFLVGAAVTMGIVAADRRVP